MPQAKRILKIEVKRVEDPDADTSYLGTYSNHADNEYAIDRAHDEDCQTQSEEAKQAIDRLERIIRYLDLERIECTETYDSHSGIIADDIGSAQDLLIDAQDKLIECDCGRGTWHNREYRYFDVCTTDPHETPEQNRKDARIAYERMESLNDGNWSYIGIRAQAEILIDSVTQRITSGGLWGIESDSDPSYLKEIEDEELSSLRDILHNLGFSKRAIATAVKDIQHS